MGLNYVFGQVRAQILLMEPLPVTNKVFSLVSQEERDRSIGASSQSAAEVVFTTKGSTEKGKNAKKDRPLCTHSGIARHTMDKCFKFHGYPPSHKSQAKASNFGSTSCQVESPMVPEAALASANKFQ